MHTGLGFLVEMQASGVRIQGLGRGRWDSKSRKLGLGSKKGLPEGLLQWRHISEKALVGIFPKLCVPFLGVPIIRSILFWGLYWGPLILGNCIVFPLQTVVSEAQSPAYF